MTNEQLQEEIARLKNERYRLRSALGCIVGLFHDSEHEAKAVAQRVLASAADEPRDDLVHGERAEALGLLRNAWAVCHNEKRPELAAELSNFIDRLSQNRSGDA